MGLYTTVKDLSLSLDDDGDFRKAESLKYLKQADVVITNPPFSKFKEYIPQLIDHQKKFIVLGKMTSLSSKNIFPLFQYNKVWYGVSALNTTKWFQVPDHYPLTGAYTKIENGRKFVKVSGICWYTNVDNVHRHEELVLYATYDPTLYPKYDNYDAIEVTRIAEIPMDYSGVMGVPISFMSRYNPDQFEILGLERYVDYPLKTKVYSEKHLRKFNGRTALKQDNGDLRQLFPRILIRRK